MSRTWFFKTLSGEIFAVDDENKAWNYFGGKGSNIRLPYIGWSRGVVHREYIKKAKDKIKEDEIEYNEILAELDSEIKLSKDIDERKELKKERRLVNKKLIGLYDHEKNLIKDGIAKEIEEATNNPDKTPPRNMEFINYKNKQPTTRQALLDGH